MFIPNLIQIYVTTTTEQYIYMYIGLLLWVPSPIPSPFPTPPPISSQFYTPPSSPIPSPFPTPPPLLFPSSIALAFLSFPLTFSVTLPSYLLFTGAQYQEKCAIL